MASKPQSESSGRPAGGILLVEEYSALQVAITSALRKFAPLHSVRVAHGFSEAEAAAELMRPDLFLLDLDPPPAGEITIFQRLKARHPEARMLVLAPGTSRELQAERGTSGAIQFIEKPFDLAEFGAAVQALLGPWTSPHSLHSRGTLLDLNLVDLVQLKCLALSSGALRLETDDGRSGAIYFRRGQICHASTGTLAGAAAFDEIANWAVWHLSETDLPAEVPATINVGWPDLLLPAARRLARESKKKTSGAARPRPSAIEQTGKRILIVDDTEMLLIFVADTLATSDPTMQIITASTGAEGIRLAATARPDLILLDYSLTDMTGDKVCHALLENAVTARIPVLMMSGHLSELARTAHHFRNVAAALAKPFLSGALINEVGRLLSAGPLPEASPAPIEPAVALLVPEAAPTQETRAESSVNGHANGGPPSAPPPRATEEPVAPSTSELHEQTVIEPPKSATTVAWPPAPRPTPSSSFVRPTEVSVTLALEVVSMQLTPSFRMVAATLQPCNPVVSVKMDERSDLGGVPLENGFRLGAIRLFDDGMIDTMRLVHTRRPPQLPLAKSSFAIGDMSLERTNSHENLRFTAQKTETMRVLLTTKCELLAVELSVAFEVVAVMLRAGGKTVMIRNSPASDGAHFALEGVELNSSAELCALLVRATN